MKTLLLNIVSFHVVRRLYKDYISNYKKELVVTLLLLLVISAATAMQPLLLQQAFDKIFKQRDLEYLAFLPMAIIAICTVQAIAYYFSTVAMNHFSNGLISDMRTSLFQKIVENEIDFHAEHDSGNLLYRVMFEIRSISSAVQIFFNSWGRQFITSLGLVIDMFYQSAELSVIALSALVCVFYPIIRVGKRLRKLVRQSNDINSTLNSRLLESFTGIRTIKAYAKEDFEQQKMGEYILETEVISNKAVNVSSITPAIMQLMGGISVAFVIWYGGYQLLHNHMTEGNLIAFTTALLMLSKPVRSLTNAGGVMNTGLVNAERFYSIIDTQPKYISRGHGKALQIDQGGIEFSNVTFEYPNGTQALKNINFSMEPGKKTALVGHSGSGKSTIFNLLLKFYEPKTGNISIDGQSISDASINSIRASIALVSQDIFIFDETARNNIGYGRAGATEAEIIGAAQAAKCHDFIMSLPQGYDTKLGFYGQNLSGGQKQRIAMARAFLRNAPILLLDEATSSLDPRTEAEIQDSLEKLTRGRTTIIIAHRLSTVMDSDKMIMLDSGTVAAVGTHEQLLAGDPAYKTLFGI